MVAVSLDRVRSGALTFYLVVPATSCRLPLNARRLQQQPTSTGHSHAALGSTDHQTTG